MEPMTMRSNYFSSTTRFRGLLCAVGTFRRRSGEISNEHLTSIVRLRTVGVMVTITLEPSASVCSFDRFLWGPPLPD